MKHIINNQSRDLVFFIDASEHMSEEIKENIAYGYFEFLLERCSCEFLTEVTTITYADGSYKAAYRENINLLNKNIRYLFGEFGYPRLRNVLNSNLRQLNKDTNNPGVVVIFTSGVKDYSIGDNLKEIIDELKKKGWMFITYNMDLEKNGNNEIFLKSFPELGEWNAYSFHIKPTKTGIHNSFVSLNNVLNEIYSKNMLSEDFCLENNNILNSTEEFPMDSLKQNASINEYADVCEKKIDRLISKLMDIKDPEEYRNCLNNIFKTLKKFTTTFNIVTLSDVQKENLRKQLESLNKKCEDLPKSVNEVKIAKSKYAFYKEITMKFKEVQESIDDLYKKCIDMYKLANKETFKVYQKDIAEMYKKENEEYLSVTKEAMIYNIDDVLARKDEVKEKLDFIGNVSRVSYKKYFQHMSFMVIKDQYENLVLRFNDEIGRIKDTRKNLYERGPIDMDRITFLKSLSMLKELNNSFNSLISDFEKLEDYKDGYFEKIDSIEKMLDEAISTISYQKNTQVSMSSEEFENLCDVFNKPLFDRESATKNLDEIRDDYLNAIDWQCFNKVYADSQKLYEEINMYLNKYLEDDLYLGLAQKYGKEAFEEYLTAVDNFAMACDNKSLMYDRLLLLKIAGWGSLFYNLGLFSKNMYDYLAKGEKSIVSFLFNLSCMAISVYLIVKEQKETKRLEEEKDRTYEEEMAVLTLYPKINKIVNHFDIGVNNAYGIGPKKNN